MHVLVTGAGGFIGLNLCEGLLRNGFEVSGISRGLKSIPCYQAPLLEELDMYHCDICSENDLFKVVSNIGTIDGIFHLAGQPYMRDSPGADSYLRSNFLGTRNVLECCRAFKIKKFVQASTYSVYGLNSGVYSPNYVPVDESHICRPSDFYDFSKYLAEQLCKFYHDRFSINMSVLRYSKVYGPGLEEGVVFNVIRKALANLPIEVRGDMSTDYVYVRDVVNANLASFEKGSGFKVYNIGSGEECTLYDLCSTILKILRSKSQLSYFKTPSSHLSLDISKAKSELNFSPVSMENGLTKEYSFYEKELIKKVPPLAKI